MLQLLNHLPFDDACHIITKVNATIKRLRNKSWVLKTGIIYSVHTCIPLPIAAWYSIIFGFSSIYMIYDNKCSDTILYRVLESTKRFNILFLIPVKSMISKLIQLVWVLNSKIFLSAVCVTRYTEMNTENIKKRKS